MKKFILLSIFLSIFVKPAWGQEPSSLEISGYYKNLFLHSQSIYTKEDISADTQRLRLEMQKAFSSSWRGYLTLDNELILHDFFSTGDFDSVRAGAQHNAANVDGDKISVDDEPVYLKHAVHRAFVKYYSETFQAVIGKQAIDWGRMRFYSPIDIFQSPSATSIENDERLGTDAINLNFSPSSFSGLNLVVVPGNEEKSGVGLKFYSKIFTYDYAIITALNRKDKIAGVLLDGYIGQAGLRAEITHTLLDNGRRFPRVALGWDYNFTSKIYVLLENFYNGGADDNDPSALLNSWHTAQQILTLRRFLTGISFQYQATPLLNVSQYVIYDWDGRSVVYNPEIKYNVTANVDISVGSQLFWGSSGSEFNDYEHLQYVMVKLYF